MGATAPEDPFEYAREVIAAVAPGPWNKYDANEGDGHGPLWAVANDAFHNPSADDETPWFAVDVHTGTEAEAIFIATFDRQVVEAMLDALETACGHPDYDLAEDMAADVKLFRHLLAQKREAMQS